MKDIIKVDYTLAFNPIDINSIVFFGNHMERAGRLFLKDGKLEFDGNVAESAKILFEEVKKLWEQRNA